MSTIISVLAETDVRDNYISRLFFKVLLSSDYYLQEFIHFFNVIAWKIKNKTKTIEKKIFLFGLSFFLFWQSCLTTSTTYLIQMK